MAKQVNLEKSVCRVQRDATAQGQGEDGASTPAPVGDGAAPKATPVLRRARRARRRSTAGLGTKWHLASIVTAALFVAFHPAAIGPAQAAPVKQANAPATPAPAGPLAPLAPCSSTTLAEPATITLGKSTLIRLPGPVARIVIGGLGAGYAGKPVEVEVKDVKDVRDMSRMPQHGGQQAGVKNGVGEADVMLLSPTELYLLGKRVGSMNVILQDRTDKCTIMDVIVTIDSGSLQAKLSQLMPEERNLKIAAADDSLIVSGEVSDALKLERVMALAAAYAPEKRIVNLMRTRAASQVMLEVKVAEVSKSLLDQLGAHLSSVSNAGGPGRWTWSVLSEFLTSGSGFVQALKLGKTQLTINGEKDDGIVRILAEPNIMAISGQQASFLSGGKIFIPVARDSGVGGTTITLEEKEFGVGVKFTPIVLEGDRINLKVASEVSELSQTGSPFTTIGGFTAVLPSFTTRRADTTVQLKDGQSFAIAGLIKNNLSESIKRFPGLGEVPILGALFRSSEFQRDMTELLFIITPRLVKPLPPNYPLPTDNFREPTRGEFLLGGTLEGTGEMPGKGQKPAPVSDAGGPTAVNAPATPSAGPDKESPKPAAALQLGSKAAAGGEHVIKTSGQPAGAVEAGARGPDASGAGAPRHEEKAVASPVADVAASIVPIPADGDGRPIVARAGERVKTDADIVTGGAQ